MRIKENGRFRNEIKFFVHRKVVFGAWTPQEIDHLRKQLDRLDTSLLKKTSPDLRHWWRRREMMLHTVKTCGWKMASILIEVVEGVEVCTANFSGWIWQRTTDWLKERGWQIVTGWEGWWVLKREDSGKLISGHTQRDSLPDWTFAKLHLCLFSAKIMSIHIHL